MRYKILSVILIAVTLLSVLCSCSPNRKRPYVTANEALNSLNGFELTSENTELDIPHTWDAITEKCVADKNGMVVIAEKLYSESYYWENEDGIPSGYTYSVMSFKECLLFKGYVDSFNVLKGKERKFAVIERYAISPEGEIIGVAYTYRYLGETNDRYHGSYAPVDYGKTFKHTSCIMENGKKYLMFFPYALSSGGVCNFIDGCYYNEAGELVQEYSEKIDSTDDSLVDDVITSAVKSYFSFEFSEEAYECSMAIVEEYEANGMTREDNDYYLYHALVKDGWEKFSK